MEKQDRPPVSPLDHFDADAVDRNRTDFAVSGHEFPLACDWMKFPHLVVIGCEIPAPGNFMKRGAPWPIPTPPRPNSAEGSPMRPMTASRCRATSICRPGRD